MQKFVENGAKNHKMIEFREEMKYNCVWLYV